MKAIARKDARSVRSRRTSQGRVRAKKAVVKEQPELKKEKRKRAQAERVAKSAALSIRIDVETRDLVDRAASASGQNRTDFMLTVLREKAIEVLLNRRLFLLDDMDWAAFAERLDDPPPPNAKLKALLAREPAWDH